MKHLLAYLILFLALLTLPGCSTIKGWFGDDEDIDPEIADDLSARQLYQKANTHLKGNNFIDAINSYSLLESRYPFGIYAQQAQLELMFLYYSRNDPDNVIAIADRFIRINPQHENVDYAHYMKGLAYFEKSSNIVRLGNRLVTYVNEQKENE